MGQSHIPVPLSLLCSPVSADPNPSSLFSPLIFPAFLSLVLTTPSSSLSRLPFACVRLLHWRRRSGKLPSLSLAYASAAVLVSCSGERNPRSSTSVCLRQCHCVRGVSRLPTGVFPPFRYFSPLLFCASDSSEVCQLSSTFLASSNANAGAGEAFPAPERFSCLQTSDHHL